MNSYQNLFDRQKRHFASGVTRSGAGSTSAIERSRPAATPGPSLRNTMQHMRPPVRTEAAPAPSWPQE